MVPISRGKSYAEASYRCCLAIIFHLVFFEQQLADCSKASVDQGANSCLWLLHTQHPWGGVRISHLAIRYQLVSCWSHAEPFRALRVAVTFDWMSIPQLSHFDCNETCSAFYRSDVCSAILVSNIHSSAFYRSDVCSAILVSNIHTIAKPPPVKPAREAPQTLR